MTLSILLLSLVACGKDSSNNGDDQEADAGSDLSFPDLVTGDDADPGADGTLTNDAVVIATCPDEDFLSPNHTPDSAVVLEMAGIDQEDLYICPGFDDFFLITLGPGEGFVAWIEFAHRIGDLDLWLFPLGTTDEPSSLAVAATEEDVEKLEFSSEEGGQFMLKVDGFEDQAGFYDITVRPSCRVDEDCPCSADENCEDGLVLTCILRGRYCDELSQPLCGDDTFEPNNTITDASDLGLDDSGSALLTGTVCAGDWDYFSLSLAEISNVSVDLEFDGGNDLDVAVLEVDGDLVGFAGTGQNPEELAMPTLSAGEYVIYIDSPAAGANELSYTLRVAVDGAEGCETNADCNYAPGRSICSDDGGCISYTPEEPNPVGGDCDSDDDCADDTWGCYTGGPGIEDNVCTLRCRGDADCAGADGGQCLSFGMWGLCFGACETDANCPVPYWCDGDTGECAYGECGTDDDCEEGQACLRDDRGTAYCRTYVETTCPDIAADGNGRISDATEFPLDPGSLEDLTICNDDIDWYTFDIAEEPSLAELSVTFDGDVDLDIHLMDSEGRTVGLGVTPTGNPEVLQADFLSAGTYYLMVTQLNDPANPVTTYSLEGSVSVVDGCDAESDDCLNLSPFRIDCQESGACGFLEGNGEVELGSLCDSDDDCVDDAEFCYMFGMTEPGENICTRQCGPGDDCDDVEGASCQALGGRFALCLPDPE